jgi:hypothetical protein
MRCACRVWLGCALALVACGEGGAEAGVEPAVVLDASAAFDALGAGDGGRSLDTAPDVEPQSDAQEEPPVDPWSTPPAGCDVTPELGSDPLLLVHRATPEVPPKANGEAGALHLVDIMVGPDDGLLYAAGLPALVVMDPSDGVPVTVGTLKGRAEHVAFAGPGRVALARRGYSSKPKSDSAAEGGGGKNKEPGVIVVDVSDPSAPTKVDSLVIEDAAGMAYVGGYLQVLTHAGGLHTLVLSQGDVLEEVHQIDGLGNPWTLTSDGVWGYVADNSKGLVVLDMSDPSAPSIATTVMAQGGAQDVTQEGDVVFLAVGSKGVQAFDVSTPTSPLSLGVTEVDGAAINVSAKDGRVWYATQQSVGVIDASDPMALLGLAVEDTPSWAMAVTAASSTAYVADWRYIEVLTVDAEAWAPDADLERDEFVFVGATEVITTALDNRGAAPLDISGISVDDPRVVVEVDAMSVPPGEHVQIRLTFSNDGEPLEASLCVSTNDPDEPVQSFPVTTASSDPNAMVGQMAPDFSLPDLEGGTHRLSQQLGHPVVLSYFATW